MRFFITKSKWHSCNGYFPECKFRCLTIGHHFLFQFFIFYVFPSTTNGVVRPSVFIFQPQAQALLIFHLSQNIYYEILLERHVQACQMCSHENPTWLVLVQSPFFGLFTSFVFLSFDTWFFKPIFIFLHGFARCTIRRFRNFHDTIGDWGIFAFFCAHSAQLHLVWQVQRPSPHEKLWFWRILHGQDFLPLFSVMDRFLHIFHSWSRE